MTAEELARFGIDPCGDSCAYPWVFATEMLKQVSRTFALNIQVLPNARLRKPILLAYLFCRMADTVEDSPTLSPAEKKHLLFLFAEIFAADRQDWQKRASAFVKGLPASWSESQDAEEYLCAHCAWPLALYFQFSARVQAPIAQCVREMCEGMADFALRQVRQEGQWLSISSEADLDRYCYFVAGVVGNMLCDLFFIQSSFITPARHARMKALAVSFGLALQLVNIIKDAAEDSSREVCFIPVDWQQAEGIGHPEALFSDEADLTPRKRVMQRMVRKAWRHLQDARDFTLLIPVFEPRIRLFCQWPMLMAVETLLEAGDGSALFDTSRKLKISRTAVKRIIRQSSLWCWNNAWLKHRFATLHSRS